ncbi:MAG: VCBS repeat-containing protein, partial [Planctomycetales bacterium]|nr:VCBS repeat-containing protein [Planctomycetales bacterium]
MRRRLFIESLEDRRLLTVEAEPNGSLATATAFLTTTDILDGNVSDINDIDYFRLALTQGQRLSLTTANANLGTFENTLPPGIELLDSNADVLFASYDGTNIGYVAPSTDTYYVRIHSDHVFGTFTDAYGMSTSVTDFSGTTEAEPNDSSGLATPLTNGQHFRGALASTGDSDFFSFSATAGQYFDLSFTGRSFNNPSVRLRRPDGSLLVTDQNGEGLYRALPDTGTYTVELASDNQAGSVTGQYVGVVGILDAGSVDAETGDAFSNAQNWVVTSSTTYAVGELDRVTDMDVYAFDVTELTWHQFRLQSGSSDQITGQNRVMALYNEFGQLVYYSNTGSLYTGSPDRSMTPGRYYLTVQASAEAGVGAYAVAGYSTSPFAPQRDVPLYFIDFTQQESHLGYNWQNAYALPETIPFIEGMFESRYDIYDVDVTLTAPAAGTEHVGAGYGDFGNIGAGGWGGGSYGTRRPSGNSVTSATATSWNSLSYSSTTTLVHEAGHATGLPHGRNVLDFMGYSNVAEYIPIGSHFPQSGTDSRRAVTQSINVRDYVDWATQSGAQVVEQEPNNSSATAENLDPYFLEMTLDMVSGGDFAVGDRPQDIETGDFNGDNRMDLLVANQGDTRVSLLLGNGNGTFQTASNWNFTSAAWFAEPLTVGDFNKDNRLDFAVTNYSDANVSVFLGNGNGTCQAPASFSTSSNPTSITTADLNGDGNPDLITTHWYNRINVLLGNGNGTFQSAVNYTTGGGAISIAVGDLNKDGRLDVVTANSSDDTFSFHLGNGDGTLQPAQAVAVGDSPESITIADFNADGNLDVATPNRWDQTASVVFGNGNGTFQAAAAFEIGPSPFGIEAADVNGDNAVDILTASTSEDVVLLLNDGSGSFTRKIRFSTGSSPYDIAAADFNGDNRIDLATANNGGDDVSVLLNIADPRNDRAVIYGRIDNFDDVDFYSFTAAANERFLIDVDSAEFQNSLDGYLRLLDSGGNLLAASDRGIDLNSGLESEDPVLMYTFATAGTYTLAMYGNRRSAGSYRLKVTPERALDTAGPQVIATWPDGRSQVDTTRQVIFFFNDHLDPATLTSANIRVQGASSGIQTGTASFNAIDASLVWLADSPLPIDTYTVTLEGDAGGLTDLLGNRLDGETDGTFEFPEISGNDTAGGDFVMTFEITAQDNTPATVYTAFDRHPYNRGLFSLYFSDEMDFQSIESADFVLRGAGADNSFGTADDRLLPMDVAIDKIWHLNYRWVRAFTRGIPDPDRYRVEATVLDAAGHQVNVAAEDYVAPPVLEAALSVDQAGTQSGLTGSYVNTSLRSYSPQDDWRASQTISGSRTDRTINFGYDDFGVRSQVGVSGGTDQDWDNFSVQWDGYITIPVDNTRLLLRSNDGSRLWIDLDGGGTFASTGNEFVNNNWGFTPNASTGTESAAIPAGTYRIRVQYENLGSTNDMFLEWITPDRGSQFDMVGNGPNVIDLSVQPNTVVVSQPFRDVDVFFSGAIDPATLTTANFRIRFSPDADFFDANDTYLVEANNAIAWNAAERKATFEANADLATGYYLIELNGSAGGITDTAGRLLDGEYLDSHITGNTDAYVWQDAHSGDGVQGGDYRAMFQVHPSSNLEVTNARLVDQFNNPIVAPVHGEQVFVRTEWTTSDLTTAHKYRVRYWIDGVPIDSDEITGAAGQGLAYNWYVGGWYATPGSHTVRVVVDADDGVLESDEWDNEYTFTFTAVAPTTLPNKFIWPVEGQPFTEINITNYVDVDPTAGILDYMGGNATYDGHTAWDLAPGTFRQMDLGVKVYAAADGIVEIVHDGEFDRQTEGFDITPVPTANAIRIDHGAGWDTIYLHLRRDSLQVEEGQAVKAGDFIGYLGSSGISTGAHLHWGVRYQNRIVEPAIDSNAYFVTPLRYVGDAPTVLRSGVTNYAPTDHLQERPSDVEVFPQEADQTTYVWARFSGLRQDDLVEYVWRKPDGSVYTTGTPPVTEDYSHFRWWISRTLPAIPDLGTWKVEFKVNGAKLGEASFLVTANGAPEIRVEDAGAIILDERYTPVDFGTVNLNGTAPTKTFTVTNHGSDVLTLAGLNVPTGFSITEGLASSLNPGQSDTFTVAMATGTAGTFAGEVRFTTNDADESEYNFSIEGIVEAAATETLVLGISERSANEGESLIANVRRSGSTAQALTVTLTSGDLTETRVPTTVTIPAGQDRVSFILDAVNDNQLDPDRIAYVFASATGYAMAQNTLLVRDIGPPRPGVIFYDSFENGLLNNWTIPNLGTEARVAIRDLYAEGIITNAVSQQFGQNGNESSLAFDSTRASGDSNKDLGIAILRVDLTGMTDGLLTFHQFESGDENDTLPDQHSTNTAGDGVSVSRDGTTWYLLKDIGGSDINRSPDDLWQLHEYDLGSEFARVNAAFSAGLQFNDEIRFKFSQYDDRSLPTDGWAIDNLKIFDAPQYFDTSLERGAFHRLNFAGESDSDFNYRVALFGDVNANTPILVSQHGSSRGIHSFTQLWSRFVANPVNGVTDLVVIAPMFQEDGRYDNFSSLAWNQTNDAAADLLLLDLVDQIGAPGLGFGKSSELFLWGFSAGGQFVGRFTAAHPNRVAAAVAGGPSSQILPTEFVSYRHGLGLDDTYPLPPGVSLNKDEFLKSRIMYWVGQDDNDPNHSQLERSPTVDSAQGISRRERAIFQYEQMHLAAEEMGLAPKDYEYELTISELEVAQSDGHTFKETDLPEIYEFLRRDRTSGAAPVYVHPRIVPTESNHDRQTFLPQHVDRIQPGQDFYVELWVEAPVDGTIGVEAGDMEVFFDTTLADVLGLEHGLFSNAVSGVLDETAGRIRDFGGSTTLSSVGVGEFALFGRIAMKAGGAGLSNPSRFAIALQRDSAQDFKLDGGQPHRTDFLPFTTTIIGGSSQSISDTIVQGVVFQDANGDGMQQPSEAALANREVRLTDATTGQLIVAPFHIEPDESEGDGAYLYDASSWVTLSVVGTDVLNPGVRAYDLSTSEASTGRLVFAHETTTGRSTKWREGLGVLRMDFAGNTQSVSIDIIAKLNDNRDFGKLEVYNASGTLLESKQSSDLADGASETVTIARPQADIAYAIAYGAGGNDVRLDNLRFTSEVRHTTGADGAYHFDDLPTGNYKAVLVDIPQWGTTFPGTSEYSLNLAVGDVAPNRDFGSSQQALSIAIVADSTSENGGSTTATVTRSNTDLSKPLVVNLSSDMTDEATVPATVTIDANQASATFTITAIDDNIVDGTQTVTIAGTASGFIAGSNTLDVVDDLEILVESGDFVAEVERLKGLAFGSGSDKYQVPNSVQLTAFRDGANALLAGDLTAAATQTWDLGYQLVRFTDTTVNQQYLGLRERLVGGEQQQGWGSYFVFPGATDNALVEVPHPIADLRSWEVGAIAFRDSNARGFLLSGAHRDANGADTADVAHLADSVFQQVHQSWNDVNGATTTWQVHGFGIGNHAFPAGTDAVISNGTGGVSGEVVTLDQRLEGLGLETYAYNTLAASHPLNQLPNDTLDGTTFASLGATTNVQRQHASTLNATFVHIELERNIRDDATKRQQVGAAIATEIGGPHNVLYILPNTTEISEQGGSTSATLHRLSNDLSQSMDVGLASNDTTEAIVPSNVTIAANASSATFTITAVDDFEIDGTQSVTITPSRVGYVIATTTISVTDSETLTVSIDVASISENGGTATGTVKRSNTDDLSQVLTVTLASSDLSEATVPATVDIPAGQDSATFTITAMDDAILDGTRPVTITATHAAYVTGGNATVDVTDYETLSVLIDADSIAENGSFTIATVTRSNTDDMSQPLTVNLLSSDTSEAMVPPTVEIPANAASATFTIMAVDDALLDGVVTVTITATQMDYVMGGVDTLDVTDYETLSLTIDAASISEAGGATTATVTRSSTDDLSQPLTVNLLSSDTSEVMVPPTVEIPADAASATFTITAVDDALLDGMVTVTIMATQMDYAVGGGDTLDVTDYETLSLTIDAASISEAGGTTTATVTRSSTDDLSQPLTLDLLSDDTTEATVPATVTILAGQASATFTITAVDDAVLDGSHPVTISATHAAYVISGSDTLVVTDHETLSLSIDAASISDFFF